MFRWLSLFTTICFGMVAAAAVMLWALNGFDGLGVSGHVLAAVLAGVFFTTAVGVGLMMLVFWSHRTKHDDLAYQLNVERRNKPDDVRLSDD